MHIVFYEALNSPLRIISFLFIAEATFYFIISGVEPWTFEQKLGEAVFIPAGCPHQVRNLKVNLMSVHEVASVFACIYSI